MPRILRTVVPRIRKSIRDRGIVTSIARSVLLPLHLVREYREGRRLKSDGFRSEFDRAHGLDTDGTIAGWTYLSDLEIKSPNWIEGNHYVGIEPERLTAVLASLDIACEDFTFIDFGSGKGRALLVASEFPFKKIIGLEFSPELHRVAEDNVRRYRSTTQKCADIEPRNVDFAEFMLPAGPLVLFFFDPCSVRVLAQVLVGIEQSLASEPRPLHVAYVAPSADKERLFAESPALKQLCRNREMNFVIYASESGPL